MYESKGNKIIARKLNCCGAEHFTESPECDYYESLQQNENANKSHVDYISVSPYQLNVLYRELINYEELTQQVLEQLRIENLKDMPKMYWKISLRRILRIKSFLDWDKYIIEDPEYKPVFRKSFVKKEYNNK